MVDRVQADVPVPTDVWMKYPCDETNNGRPHRIAVIENKTSHKQTVLLSKLVS